MMKNSIHQIALLFWVLLFPACGLAAPRHAAIASAHPLATEAGFEILQQGGNAFDAAVAVSAVLGVAEPFGSGFGGGGFWLLKRGSDGREIMVDGRETAPMAADAGMYLDERGEPIPRLSLDGPLAAGVPGMPAALALIATKYGRLSLKKDLAPAIRLAEQGLVVAERYHRAAKTRESALRDSPAAAEIFLDRGSAPMPGFRLVQRDLAGTLRRFAEKGHAGFYRGSTATALVAQVRKSGGIWTLDDLRRYRAIEREPLRCRYQGVRVVSAAPPSSGGVVLAEALNVLSAYDLENADPVTRRHLIIEAERRAYRDRDQYLGDPDFVRMPIGMLTSPDYSAGLRVAIRPDRALHSENLSDAGFPGNQGANTSHFSIIDRQGNQVAATLSINQSFGSGFVAQGTGVLLNDEMDDFAVSPGKPNAYGLVGGRANAIEPGKRMLSSMTPTFLETKSRSAILGTPGGSRIISMVLLAILDFAEGHGPDSWVSVPRFHHQYLPDVVEHEPGALAEEEVQGLEKLGHTLRRTAHPYGDMHAVLWDKSTGAVEAASDPRGEGSAEVR